MRERLKVRSLKKSEREDLEPLIKEFFPDRSVLKTLLKSEIKIFETEDVEIYLVGPHFMLRKAGRTFPALTQTNEGILQTLPSVKVDMGAVGPVTSGADIMRPGIKVFIGEFNAGDMVVVRDEIYSKPLAIGEALIPLNDAYGASRGRVVKNLHHVEDKEWKIITSGLLGG